MFYFGRNQKLQYYNYLEICKGRARNDKKASMNWRMIFKIYVEGKKGKIDINKILEYVRIRLL